MITTPRRGAPAPLAGDPIPAIGYVRVSKAREEMISPELQREAIREWARRNGRHLLDVVEEVDVSGRHWNRRIMGVIARIEAGEAREVIVWKYSRFGRDRLGCALNLGRINRAGGELISATEEVDASTAVGRMTRGMLMEIAAFESDRMAEIWAETWAWRIEHGLPPRGGPRIGYRILGRLPNPLGGGTVRDPNTTEVYVPDESSPATELLPHLYEAYVTGGGGFRYGAQRLNEAAVTTTRGKPWTHTAVRRMMDAGFAAGFIHVHDPACTGPHDPTRRRACPNRIHLPGAHEALIGIDLWEAYRERRAAVAAMPRGTRAAEHLYTGTIWCGHCGARHSGAARRYGVRYSCSRYTESGGCAPRSIGEDRITPIVLDMISAYADRIDAEARRITPTVDTVPDVDQVAELTRERARLDARLDRLLDRLADDTIGREEYQRARERTLAARARVEAELAQAEARAAERREVADRIHVARSLLDEWDTLALPHRRELVRILVDRITVYRQSRNEAHIVVTLADGTTREVDVSTDWDAVAARARAGWQRVAAARRAARG